MRKASAPWPVAKGRPVSLPVGGATRHVGKTRFFILTGVGVPHIVW